MPKKIDINKLLKRSILLIILVGIVGVFLANRVVRNYGYDGISDFVTNYTTNKILANKADPVRLNIQMSDDDFTFLENKRQEALDRGIQINIGDNYVDCQISTEDTQIDAEIRLKGHMTDHLEGDKWSFRVKSDEEILGMYRFSLQHPGTRNYAYEWVYHQLLKEEGIIHLKYDFVHVQLRDKDLGIYALEEHFGQHVIERNNRPPGAILRWNPNLYWEWRIDELDGVYLDEQYSAYISSFAEPYDRGTVKRDTVLLSTYLMGAALLEAFRKGEKTTSEVFDVELMAKFHAIIDLVGGHHSLDWSDVKFYYNSATGRIEPVGYESFSIRKTERIAGQRIPDNYAGIAQNYHDQLFADPIFYKAYIENLQRICNEAYFSEFIQKIKPEHEEKLAILALEWPHRKFSFDPYYENIELIRHNLELPKPFHAFIGEQKSDSLLTLSFAPVSDYPIELIELEIDKKETIKIKDFILPPKARDEVATYFHLDIIHHTEKLKNLVIKARIPGGSKKFKVDVIEYPPYKKTVGVNNSDDKYHDLKEHPDVVFIEKDSTYFFDAAEVNIDRNYYISGGQIKLLPGQKILFVEGTLNVINGSIESIGTKENQVQILTDNYAQYFYLNKSVAVFNNTTFAGAERGIVAINSEMMFEHCIIADITDDFIRTESSILTFRKCQMGSVNRLGMVYRTELSMKDVSANKGHMFVTSQGSNIKIVSSNIKGFDEVFDLNQISTLRMWSTTLDDNKQIGSVAWSSEFHTYSSDLGNADIGIVNHGNDEFGGKSTVNLYKTKTNQIKKG